MIFLSIICLSTPVIVTSFTQLPSTTIVCSTSPPARAHQQRSHGLSAKRRGGAMSRRKKNDDNGDDGFDQISSELEKPTTAVVTTSSSSSSSSSATSDSIYSMPPLYDLAFGYRSYEDEIDFLIDVHEKYADSSAADKPLRILELAAGPARHSLAVLSENPPSAVDSVVALDRSQDMVDYGMENADYELGAPGGRRDDFHYVNGDMRNAGGDGSYTTPHFNTAWLLLGSMQHLLANEDIIACLSSVHSIIKPGGTVVIELPHPRETFKMGECTRNGWNVPLVEGEEDGNENEYGSLDIIWGEQGDEFDPVAQVRQFTVGMELTVNNVENIPKDGDDISDLFLKMSKEGKTSLREIVPMRLFTLQEVDLLARCAGFEMVAKYGALDEVDIENEEEAFRMVCVLKKS